MSPVFGHGRLRLYLLKLLEESPKHGYEVIRLLQDRFLGVYSPSPGTIYPRLARLEEEGLVTHQVVDGKKVFTLTDKGRAELNSRLDELAELEQEITASVQDIAREVKEDVRQTVRSLRHELTQMAKDINQTGRRESHDVWREQKDEWKRQRQQQKEEWKRHKQQWRAEAERWQREWDRIWAETWSLGGPPPSRGRADAEFGQMLAEFVAQVQREAHQGEISERALDECRSILDEAAARIRDTLRP
ncbi:PadR family transcriptional regulator [Microtetraspora fusca]|uniref:PadR family transcriptional regulator n=1 Tax=Microtetraspora fusca TaxID=1997 RepID=UPI000834A6CB|nr:PadR family transcriptional regulator [Microtetraspora fusca]